MPYVLKLAEQGVHAALTSDPGFLAGLNVAAGQVTYKPVADAVGLPYVPVDGVLDGIPAGAA